jgi:putative transposase
METINGSFEAECIRTTVYAGPYKTLADVEYATAGRVDWYNNRRIHGSIGMARQLNTSKPTTLPQADMQPR